MIIAFAGLPATGKTTLSNYLNKKIDGCIYNKDEIRSLLFPKQIINYSNGQDDFCINILYQTIEYVILNYPNMKVIIDGRTFTKKYQVDDLISLSVKLSTRLKIIECICSDEIAKKRIESDEFKANHIAENRTYQLYLDLKENADPITFPKKIIETDKFPIEESVNFCLEYIQTI